MEAYDTDVLYHSSSRDKMNDRNPCFLENGINEHLKYYSE